MSTSPFIPAKPDALSKAFWGRYFEWTLRRHFRRCLVTGEDHAVPSQTAADPIPTIYACTHGSWWDAAVTIVLSLRRYGLDADGMMEYRQLTKYRFFSRIGMFSVVREDPRSALRSLSYAAERLRGTDRALWMFPQGTLVHQDEPILAEPGIGILAAKLGRVRIVPVAMRYELLRDQHPTCWVRIDHPLVIDVQHRSEAGGVSDAVSNALTRCSSLLRADAVVENDAAYRIFVKGRSSLGS